MSNIFTIDNLKCSYDNGKSTALFIENVDIQKGKLIFVLGKSGIGKSTLLEALGLMTNTISNKDNKVFFHNDTEQVRLDSLWAKNNLSEFRSQFYSFIFQSNNLMDNFSAGENMAFGLLLTGKTMQESKSYIEKIMLDIDLPVELFGRNIQSLSGGQRQRLAFVRAITAPFKVMFCDEPTGNLDKIVSYKLLNVLKNKISENQQTAIIVSHNIDLAISFADEIFTIVPDSKYNGYLSNEMIFRKVNNDWLDSQGNAIENPQNKLLQTIQ